MEWSDLSYLLRSPLSRQILKALEKENLAPVEIAKKTSIDKGNVSHKLSELSKRRLVECLNPNDRKWRFYKITDHGKKILKVSMEKVSD